MSDWPIQPVSDHGDQAVARLVSQYSEADRLRALIRLWADRVQEAEDAAYTVLTERWVPEAVGVQLDEMGAIVGEPRLGRTDAEYREAIEVRISVNRSGGEPERIIEFLLRIAGADEVLYKEIYPAKVEIFVLGDVSLTQAQRIRELIPAGVGTIYISESGGDLPFGFSELTEPSFTDRDGFGELGVHALAVDGSGTLLDIGGGVVLGVNDNEDPLLPTEGGVFSELYEV